MLKLCVVTLLCFAVARGQLVCPEDSWTSWYDRDDPSGFGDFETLPDLRNEHPEDNICTNPTIVEARLIRTKEPYDPDLPNIKVNTKDGFICYNSGTVLCQDYEARFCCPKISPLCLNATGYPIDTEPFAKPDDCFSFYQCANGYLFVQLCPSGLVFNPELRYCDWPRNVPSCDASSGDDSTTVSTTVTTATPQGPVASPYCVDDNGNPISTPPFATEEQCSNLFYQCSNGYLYTFKCAPEGLVFNPVIGACDYPQNVDSCLPESTNKQAETTEATTTTQKPVTSQYCVDENGSPISTAPFATEETCSNLFYQCSNGYLYTFECAPEGLVFNPELGACDYPKNVDSCQTESTDVPTETTTTTQKPVTSQYCVDENGNPITTEPFATEETCSHFFYQCSNGYLSTFECAPSGLVFNPDLKACDYPANVDECNTK